MTALLPAFPCFSQAPLHRFEYRHPAMGTLFRIVCYAPDSLLAGRAARAAFMTVDSLEMIFSDYREDSELSRLSAQSGSGRKVKVSAPLWDVLRLSKTISRKSDGAFDVTIGPLSHLWRRSFRQNEFPGQDNIDAARERVNWRWLRLCRSNRVKLKRKNMRLDLGGIAKGYALDKAMARLNQFHIDRALVDGGGDLLLGPAPPGQTGWDIAQPGGKARLAGLSIAVSGDRYRYLDWEGKRYSHLIDPRTGIGVTHGLTVSVQAPTGALADALASACSILGPGRTDGLMQAFPGCSVSFRQK